MTNTPRNRLVPGRKGPETLAQCQALGPEQRWHDAKHSDRFARNAGVMPAFGETAVHVETLTNPSPSQPRLRGFAFAVSAYVLEAGEKLGWTISHIPECWHLVSKLAERFAP